MPVLPLTTLFVIVATPPLATPPAEGPPRAEVAVLASTLLFVIASVLLLPGAPPFPLPLAIPPPLAEVLRFTSLLMTLSVPERLTIPPPPPVGAELSSTWLLFSIVVVPVVPTGIALGLPLAIPPPPWAAVFPSTTVSLSVSVASSLKMPPPTVLLPPVISSPLRVRFPLGASTWKIRNVLELPANVALLLPFIVMELVMSGRAFAPVRDELLATVKL